MQNESERDRMLVQLWHRRLQAYNGRYNIDRTHRCMHERPYQIVRPFVCAPHFYGCLACGQTHRCYADPHLCVTVVDPEDDTTVSCQFSGAVLAITAQSDFVGTQSEQDIANDNSGITCERYLAKDNQSGRIYRPRKPMLYSNIRVRVPRGTPEQKHREKRHPSTSDMIEKQQQQQQQQDECESETSGDDQHCSDDAEDGDHDNMDGEDDERCGIARYLDGTSAYTNEQYWDSRFSYLRELPYPLPPSDVAEFSEYQSPVSIEPTAQQPNHFDCALLDEQLQSELSDCVSRLLGQMLSLQFISSYESPTLFCSAKKQLVNFFLPRVQAIALLLYNSPVMVDLVVAKEKQLARHTASVTTVSRSVRHEYVSGGDGGKVAVSVLSVAQICEALMLHLFTEDYCDEDQCGNRIIIWCRCQWLTHLVQCHVMEVLFGECQPSRITVHTRPPADVCDTGPAGENTRKRKMAVVATTAPPVTSKKMRRVETENGVLQLDGQCTRKRVKQSVAIIRDCLTHYKGHALWLRHFILDRGKS